ncbi:MAG TPA: hypothetical protein VH914_00580 [Acidimicrobiia bacterium]|nr:hypothetical protein [Acidimicrobiia bacterium]
MHGTRKAAERAELRLQDQVEDGRARVDRPTVGELLDRWLEHARPSLAVKTFEGYERIVELRLKPELGAMRLERLRGSDLDALYAKMLDEGRAPATVRQVHAVAHRACRQALRWDW